MSMMKERLRDIFSYVEFPVTLGFFSVQSLEMLQKGMESVGFHPVHGNLVDIPLNVSLVAASMGVSVGNAFLDNHSVRDSLPHAVWATGIGMMVGIGTEHMPASAYITAFSVAAAGMILRRNVILYETIDDARERPRNKDFDL